MSSLPTSTNSQPSWTYSKCRGLRRGKALISGSGSLVHYCSDTKLQRKASQKFIDFLERQICCQKLQALTLAHNLFYKYSFMKKKKQPSNSFMYFLMLYLCKNGRVATQPIQLKYAKILAICNLMGSICQYWLRLLPGTLLGDLEHIIEQIRQEKVT